MTYVLLFILLAVLAYWGLGPGLFTRLRSRHHRRLEGVIVSLDGYIRPNVIQVGGGYRLQVLAQGEALEVLVADHRVYQSLRPGAAVRMVLFTDADHPGWWLRSVTAA